MLFVQAYGCLVIILAKDFNFCYTYKLMVVFWGNHVANQKTVGQHTLLLTGKLKLN